MGIPATGWLNPSSHANRFVNTVLGEKIGVTVNNTIKPTSAEVRLMGQAPVTVPLSENENTLDNGTTLLSYQMHFGTTRHAYVGYYALRRDHTYSVKLIKQEAMSEEDMNDLYNDDPPANTTEEIDDDIPFG